MPPFHVMTKPIGPICNLDCTYCHRCEARFACNGECPKHRFITPPDGEDGLSYLCPTYKKFFTHIDAPMRMVADLLRAGRAPAEIMGIHR